MEKIVSIFGSSLLVIAALLSLSTYDSNNNNIALGQQQAIPPSQTQDSVTVLMDGKAILGKNFIHLYDSTPSSIALGHVAAHLPCDGNGESTVKVVAGVAPNVAPLNLTRVDEMSILGTICMYHADLPSPSQQNATITDIALLNPTEQSIVLPDTTSVVIHVSEFASATAGEHS
jgi:hypothetical protein